MKVWIYNILQVEAKLFLIELTLEVVRYGRSVGGVIVLSGMDTGTKWSE